MKYKMYLCWEPSDNLTRAFWLGGEFFCRSWPIELKNLFKGVSDTTFFYEQWRGSVSSTTLFRICNIVNSLPYGFEISCFLVIFTRYTDLLRYSLKDGSLIWHGGMLFCKVGPSIWFCLIWDRSRHFWTWRRYFNLRIFRSLSCTFCL